MQSSYRVPAISPALVHFPGAESHITHRLSNRIAILPSQNNYYPSFTLKLEREVKKFLAATTARLPVPDQDI
jgi:hypothetical protein